MFEKKETTEKVIGIIAHILNRDITSIEPHATIESLGADSLDRLEMIMKMEEVFGIDISDEDEAKIKTVEQAIEVVHARRSK